MRGRSGMRALVGIQLESLVVDNGEQSSSQLLEW